MFGRNKVAMVVAEFLGAFSLVMAMYAMIGRTAFPFFLAAAGGATLGLMALVVGGTSGAYGNPALTLAMWTRRKVGTTVAIVYIAAQMLGGVIAWSLLEYLLDSPLKSIAGDKFMMRVLVAEAIGALLFAFGAAAAMYQGYRGLRYAATIGGSFALGILVATFASNGLLNPAIAVGVKSWNWAYVVGPLLGAVVGANLHDWLFVPVAVAPKAVAKATSPRRSVTTKKAKTTRAKKKR